MAILQTQSAAADPSALPPARESRAFAWTDLLPVHRASTVAKTTLLVALGYNVAHGRFVWGGIGASLILTSLLWAVLYAINEAYDLTLENRVAVPRGATNTLLALCGLLCLAAAAISPALAVAFLAMTAGQLAYCLPWPRLKQYWWPILLLGGVLNPVLRTMAGAIWGVQPLPAVLWVSIILVHVGATIRTRIMQRERDRRLHYRIAPAFLDQVGAACVLGGLGLGAYLCAIDVIPRICLLTAPPSIGFTLYAWSRRATGMAPLRKGWGAFAIGTVFVLVALLLPR